MGQEFGVADWWFGFGAAREAGAAVIWGLTGVGGCAPMGT